MPDRARLNEKAPKLNAIQWRVLNDVFEGGGRYYPSNHSVTLQALRRRGLVSFRFGRGWIIEPAGAEALRIFKEANPLAFRPLNCTPSLMAAAG